MNWRKHKKVHSLFCSCRECLRKNKSRRHGKTCHCDHCCKVKDKKIVKNFYLLILGSVIIIAILF